MDERLLAFGKLLDIMDNLRINCPWDKKQTIESLRYLTIEETYELSDAILENNFDDIKKELGDLLLHIVFYSKIGEEQNKFNILSVIENINAKLINRHPHIFGDVVVENEEQVKSNWEKIKIKEGNKSVLGGVPKGLPAMIKACRIQEKARGVGFDWKNSLQVWEKVKEELKEFEKEIENNSSNKKIEAEFGDIIFSLINYARFLNINPEDALEKTNSKFINRFNYIENKAKEKYGSITGIEIDEMEELWNEYKLKFEIT